MSAGVLRLGAITGVGIAMLAWSWGTWPNIYVDFGRELYVPWRLAEGEVLYRDIAWFNGPLSAYWNAAVFSVFGPSLRALVLANLAIVAGIVWLSYSLISRIGDRLTATVSCLVFLTLFAFSRIDPIGNDNYLTPYAHEVTHGIFLSLLGLRLFSVRRERPIAAALGSGLALGAVALTKAEVFLAAAAALGLAWALDLWAQRRAGAGDGARAATIGACFIGGTALPPLAAFASLASVMPAGQALLGTLGSCPGYHRGSCTVEMRSMTCISPAGEYIITVRLPKRYWKWSKR